MKNFKYFSKEAHAQAHPFWWLPEVYYQNELGLASKLQAEDSPGIVLYNETN